MSRDRRLLSLFMCLVVSGVLCASEINVGCVEAMGENPLRSPSWRVSALLVYKDQLSRDHNKIAAKCLLKDPHPTSSLYIVSQHIKASYRLVKRASSLDARVCRLLAIESLKISSGKELRELSTTISSVGQQVYVLRKRLETTLEPYESTLSEALAKITSFERAVCMKSQLSADKVSVAAEGEGGGEEQ